MTTIKILYKDIPGRNLVSSADGVRIWNRNIRAIDQVHTNSLLPILDLLGLDYVFSKDADAVPIIDVGSLDPSSEKFTAICDNAANTYKKFILCTTQEPWQWHHVEQLLEKYHNIFLLDSSTPLEDNGIFHERYGNFPTMICRMLSPQLHITASCGNDLTYQHQRKKYTCLLARWRVEKHLLFSMLSYYNLLNDGIVTYRPLLRSDEKLFIKPEQTSKEKINEFKASIHFILKNTPADFVRYAVNGIIDFPVLKLNNDVHFDECQFSAPDDSNKNPSPINWHDPVIRAQPKYLFEESYFSVIGESLSNIMFDENNQPINMRAYVSEKSMVPIINGHPWLVLGEPTFYRTMQQYGFEPHDELFDLSYDDDLNFSNRLYAIKQNLESIDEKFLSSNLRNFESTTHKKIRHNRHNIFHTNSKMWKELRKNMLSIFDRFRDINV